MITLVSGRLLHLTIASMQDRSRLVCKHSRTTHQAVADLVNVQCKLKTESVHLKMNAHLYNQKVMKGSGFIIFT